MVLLAGTGVPGKILLPEQDRLICVANNERTAEVAKTYAFEKSAFAAVVRAHDADVAEAAVRQVAASSPEKPEPGAVDQLIKAARRPWMRWFLDYDPAPTLRRVRAPVLVLAGEKDLQVPPSLNLPPMRAALAENPRATIRELPGLNHAFQHAASGSPSEYAAIEETVAHDLLQAVFSWIERQVA